MLPLVLAVSASVPCAAQSVLHQWTGPDSEPFYGSAVAHAGDVDGDGYGDVWVSDPFGGGGRGVVELHSGRTSGLLTSMQGGDLGSEFGAALAGAADMDGDGLPDVLIGEPRAAGGGLVHVRTGSGGVLALFDQAVADADLGRAVAFVGDVNADGFVDVCAGAPRAGMARSGAVHVWSGKDGTPLHLWTGFEVDDGLGRSVAGVGDVDADGRPDVAAGAPQTVVAPGYVQVWSGYDSVLLHHFVGEGDGDRFGAHVAGVGDLDGDMHADVLVGMPGADLGATDTGGLAVWSGLTGTALLLTPGPHAFDALGSSVSAAGDVDLDGDLDVAAANLPFFGGGFGVIDGSTGNDELWLEALGEGSLEALEGLHVAGGHDVNGDGLVDLAAGVARRIIASEPGVVQLVSPTSLPWTRLPEGALVGTGGVAPWLDGLGVYEPSGEALLRLTDALPGAAAVFVLGLDVASLPFKGGTLIPSPDLGVPGFVVDAQGRLDVPTLMPPLLPPGTQLVYQVWIDDSAAPAGFSASNGLVLAQP